MPSLNFKLAFNQVFALEIIKVQDEAFWLVCRMAITKTVATACSSKFGSFVLVFCWIRVEILPKMVSEDTDEPIALCSCDVISQWPSNFCNLMIS